MDLEPSGQPKPTLLSRVMTPKEGFEKGMQLVYDSDENTKS